MRKASEPSSASAVSENRLTIQRHAGRHAGEDSERDARIHDEHEVEEVRNHDDRVDGVEPGERPLLRQLVRDEYRRRESQDERHPAAPARMTGTQRSQSAGCSGSRPTAGLHVQQRPHFRPSACRTSTASPGSAVSRRTTRSGPVASPAGGAPHAGSELRDDQELPKERRAVPLHDLLEAPGRRRRASHGRRARRRSASPRAPARAPSRPRRAPGAASPSLAPRPRRATPDRRPGSRSRWTLRALSATRRWSHTSSAVNVRIGAMRRTSASRIR